MNCTCIKDLEAKMIEHFKPQAGDNVEAECRGVGINFDTGGMSLAIPWTIRGTARGFKSLKGYDTYVVASCCPFCGRTAGSYTVGEYAGLVPLTLETK